MGSTAIVSRVRSNLTMRMLTLALLLASATSVPAFAEPDDPASEQARNSHSQPTIRERLQAGQVGGGQPENESRAARYEAMARAREARGQQQPVAIPDSGHHGNWRSQAQPQAAQSPPVAQPQPSRNHGQWDGNRSRHGRGDSMSTNAPPVTTPQRREDWAHRNNGNGQNGGNWSGRHDGPRGDLPSAQGSQRRWDGRRNDDRHWDGDRENGQNGVQRGGWRHGDNGRWERRGDHHRNDRNWNNGSHHRDWNRTWRSDRRYDWHGYRNQYRHQYRQPRYYNPYGYRHGYQRFGIGIYLDSLFFGNRYWLNDPWEYRLPPAPYGTRWVRYYDDVLLVDTRSGYVVDAIYGFFW